MALPNSHALALVKPSPSLHAVSTSSWLCPSISSFMADDVALEKFVEVHRDVLDSCSQILDMYNVILCIPSLITQAYGSTHGIWALGWDFSISGFVNEALVHYQRTPVNLTLTAYQVLNTFERLNRIYEKSMGLPEFRVMYFFLSQPLQVLGTFSRAVWVENGTVHVSKICLLIKKNMTWISRP